MPQCHFQKPPNGKENGGSCGASEAQGEKLLPLAPQHAHHRIEADRHDVDERPRGLVDEAGVQGRGRDCPTTWLSRVSHLQCPPAHEPKKQTCHTWQMLKVCVEKKNTQKTQNAKCKQLCRGTAHFRLTDKLKCPVPVAIGRTSVPESPMAVHCEPGGLGASATLGDGVPVIRRPGHAARVDLEVVPAAVSHPVVPQEMAAGRRQLQWWAPPSAGGGRGGEGGGVSGAGSFSSSAVCPKVSSTGSLPGPPPSIQGICLEMPLKGFRYLRPHL